MEIFSIYKLKIDTEIALEAYFIDLETDLTLKSNFDKRLNHLGILEKTIIPTMTDIHGEVIRKYDDLPDLLPGLKFGMYNPTDCNQ